MGVAERQGDQAETEEFIEEEASQDEPEADKPEGEEGGDESEAVEGGDEEVVVSLGDEEAPASEEKQAAPAWVKELRQSQKELRRENAELKAKLQTGQPAEQKKPELPEYPKLADFDYDEDKHRQAVLTWTTKQREIERWDEEQKERQKKAEEAVQAVHANYAKSKQGLKVRDFQDAEDEALRQLSQLQQSIVIAGASNPAAMVYALGKNPKELRRVASIKDPVKFAVEVGKLEKDLKVTTRTSTKSAPDTPLRKGSGSATATSATLERLEAEAAKTGDRTKVVAYRRQLNQQGQK